MDPPSKPWERVLPQVKDENTIWQEMRNAGPAGDQPPPIPPRPDESINRSYMGMPSQSYGGMGSFGSSFGSPFGMYGSGYSSYGCGLPGYSRFGMGGYGSGGYGQTNDNDFVRIAEESSRQAFQSIESIVQAFASVSMMLESTYFAVHSSFRAVLGVADHFSRLKGQMSQMLSALAVIKYLSWFVRRILYLLHLSENDPNEEDVWRRCTSSKTNGFLTPESVVESLTKPERKKSSWPILIFFSVVFGTPWLIWKLLTSLTGGSSNEQESRKWMSRQGDHYVAIGLYNFATNNPKEVAFEANQELVIAPKELQPRVKGWLLASLDGQRCGLVPAAYIKILCFKSYSPENESVKGLKDEEQ